MQSIDIQYFETRYGKLILGSFDEKLCLCDWRYRHKRNSVDARIKAGLMAEYREKDNTTLVNTRRQLNEYFSHDRKVFDIPLLPVGTAFQKRVWDALLRIPFGKTMSYLELAKEIGDRNAVRAVASANGANALSILVPCHRIIGSNGKLVGYAGGTKTKADLLGLEFDLFN